MPNKIFIYTVSDFKNKAVECIEMMFAPFLKQNDENIKLAIIANKKCDILINEKIEVIIDNDINSSKYIGFLKYSKNIPNGYRYYLYIDSDILLLGNKEILTNTEFEYTIVQEEWLKMTNHWHCYKYCTAEEFKKMSNLNGINAGTFGYKDIKFLSLVRNLHSKYITNNLIENAMLEQSSFNYAICKKLNFNLENVLNLTNKTCFFAQDRCFDKEKIIYHFNGFSNQMESKYQMMKNFLYKNDQSINI